MEARNAKIMSLLCMLGAPLLHADNPVVSHRQLADPNGFVFKDRLYAICSNDDDNDSGYDMKSAVVISTKDLMNWTDHGDVFRVTRDAKWASGSYAPTAVAANGRVYLYFPNIASGIGVLTADKPEGPYKDPLGKALISGNSMCPMSWCFDPVVFVDDDAAASAYLVWGGGTPYGSNFRGIALNKDMISLQGSMSTPETPNSFEGPFVHKYDGHYYIHYPVRGGSNLEYAMSSTSPISGYTSKGVLLPNPSLNGKNINGYNNSHGSIVRYQGAWYLMYHDRRLATSSTYKRDVSIDRLEYNADGTMEQVVVTTGMAQIGAFNPYDSIPATTMSGQSGIKAVFNAGTWVNYLVPQNTGAWIRISGVDFGTGAKRIQINAATAASGVKMEVRTGSESGALAGTCTIASTGSMSRFTTATCDMANLTGIKDVFLKFAGTTSNTNVAWFRFEPVATSIQHQHSITPMDPSSDAVEYSVHDLRGHSLGRFSAAPGTSASEAWSANVHSLPSGTYIVAIRSSKGVWIGKFVHTGTKD